MATVLSVPNDGSKSEAAIDMIQKSLGEDALVHLQDLLDGGSAAVDACKLAMMTRGWIVVKLTDRMQGQSAKLRRELNIYFRALRRSKSQQHRFGRQARRLSSNSVQFGYELGHDRQSLRFMTGTELKQHNLPLSKRHSAVEKTLFEVANETDQVLRRFAELMVEHCLFGTKTRTTRKFGETNGLPLLLQEEMKKASRKPAASYGLFEAVRYENDHRQGDEKDKESSNNVAASGAMKRSEMNCAPHFDPGLFSFNVLSDESGLQFQDEAGDWYDMPLSPEYGVLWAGAAARDASRGEGCIGVVPAVHRVLRPSSSYDVDASRRPRLSAWNEICNYDQVFADGALITDRMIKDGKLLYRIPNVFSDNDEKEPYVISAEPGKIREALQIVQDLKGLPYTKIIRVPAFNNDGEVIGIK